MAAPRLGCAHTIHKCCSPRDFSLCTATETGSNSYSVSSCSCWPRIFQQHQGETTSAFNVAHEGVSDLCASLNCSQGGCPWSWETQPLLPTKHSTGRPLVTTVTSTTSKITPSNSCQGKRGLEAPRKHLFLCLFLATY